MSDISKNTSDNFSRIFPAYLDVMAKLLIDLRKAFDGDLDKALIMTVIGDRQYARRVDVDTPTLDGLGTTPTTQATSIDALSIAQLTDIPRETVRRKVGALIELGWVSCDETGNLAPTKAAAEDLDAWTRSGIKFIDSMARITRP